MPGPALFVHRFRALGSDNEIQLYADDAEAAQRLAQSGIDEAARVEVKYSRYLADSLISRINRAAGGAPIEIDTETGALLDYADTCYRQSGGMFDLTSGVLRRVWDFRRGIVPDSHTVSTLLPLIGWKLVERSELKTETGTAPAIRLAKTGMELDFGGIGKEYCADRVAGVLLAAGVRHGLVNLGGDVRVIGPHPDGAPWSVGIRHPRKDSVILTSLRLAQGGLATSGDYERFFERDGRRYCHMLDPHTGYPAATMQTVTVIAPLCTVAGSISTLAMLKGEGGADFLRGQSYPFIAVDADGVIHDMLGPA
jgi:thiamine biosynthesis lipoprotein